MRNSWPKASWYLRYHRGPRVYTARNRGNWNLTSLAQEEALNQVEAARNGYSPYIRVSAGFDGCASIALQDTYHKVVEALATKWIAEERSYLYE